MRPSVRLALMRQLVSLIDQPPREDVARLSRLSIARYIDPAELEKEHRALFRRSPIIVAHTSELPEPGDFVTETVAGVPLIIARDTDGRIRVLVNACRHRGARLVDEPRGCGKKALTCPYHAWSYRLDGALLHVPHQAAFGRDLDPDALGLRIVQHQVRHGFVWATLDAEQEPDVAAFLGPVLDDDFEAFDLASHRSDRTSVRSKAANWKLVMDAFAEGYHLKSLHQQSLARFFLDVALVDDCAPHVRQVGARKSLADAAGQPEHTWDLRKHTTVFYNVFPSAVLVFHPHWLSQLSLFPEAVDRVRVVHRMLIPAGAVTADQRARLDRSFAHIDEHVFAREDLAIAESIQSTLASGANDAIMVGGREEGMRLFHHARDRALARASSSDTPSR